VLVAWNGGKEASAALLAAVPILRRAARATIVAFQPARDAGLDDAHAGSDLVAFLARHEVQADFLSIDRHIDAGRELLTMAAQERYDLLVIGCYGHSQFRELFLGGVTRTLLHEATIPVLMAR
jgi:nucleotide-binding universal stress UspA family protein